MLTITECRKLFKSNAEHLTDEQVKQMTDYLNLLYKVVYEQLKREDNEKQSYSLC
jgi:hypothetical protein